MAEKPGTLYLIPNVLNSEAGPLELVIPSAVMARIGGLRRFVVEGERAAWRLLAKVMDKEALAAVTMDRLDEHTPMEALPGLLAPALRGEDLGLMSEAGLPCIADPGGALVAAAHAAGIRVVPLTGPSSLLLALSASGLDGQRFTFLGYLPQERMARRAALLAMERAVRSDGGTRLFIETPYRNDKLLADCLEVLSIDTRLCVAAGLTTEAEMVRQESVAQWRSRPCVIGKVPAVFLVGRPPGTQLEGHASKAKPAASQGKRSHQQKKRPP